MESCHLAVARRVKLWSLNANLFFEEPHQLSLVCRFIGPFKPYLAENFSLQSSNCNILGLAATVAFSANEVVDAPFFYISHITNSSTFIGKIFRKKVNFRKFSRERP